MIDPKSIDLTPKEPILYNSQSNPIIEIFEAQLLKRYMIRNFELVRGIFEEVKADIAQNESDILDNAAGIAANLTSINNINDYLDYWKEGFVFPEEFGAVGDGVANDNTAVQDALDTGKIVLIRPGKTYAITNLIVGHGEYLLGIGGKFVTHSSIGASNRVIIVTGHNATVDSIDLEVNHPCTDVIRLAATNGVDDFSFMRFINNKIKHNSSAQLFSMEKSGSNYFRYSLVANNLFDAANCTRAGNLSFFRGAKYHWFLNNTLLVNDDAVDAWRWFDSQELFIKSNTVIFNSGNANNGRAFRIEPTNTSDFVIFTGNHWRAPRGCTFINLDNAVCGNNIGHCTLLNGYWLDGFGFDNIITHDNVMRVNGATYLVNYALSATKVDVDNIKN